MFDIRNHGGIFGGSKYRKGSVIPVWLLNPIAPHITSDRFVAWGINNYRPTLDYCESNSTIYVGAGRIAAITQEFGISSTLNLSDRSFTEILVFKGKVFGIASVVYQASLDLTTYSVGTRGEMLGLVPIGDFLYSFSNSDKLVYKFDASQSTLTVLTTLALLNATDYFDYFQGDDTNFFFGTSKGNLVKYDLNGNLLKTLNLHTSTFSSMQIVDNYIYIAVGNVLHKVDKNTLTKVWTITLVVGGGLISSIQSDKNYLYITHSSQGVFIVSTKDGSLTYKPTVVVQTTSGNTSSIANGKLRGNIIYMTTWMRSTTYDYQFNLIKMPVKQTLV